MDTADKDKKSYEIAVLVKTEGELSGIATMVGQHNAELVGEFQPKKLALAYPIQKQREGIFAFGTFRAYAEDAKKLEESLRMHKDILRFMILTLKANAMAQAPTGIGAGAPGAAPRRRPMTGAPAGYGSGSMGLPSAAAPRPAAPATLSNEALEKKIEEILK